MSQRHAFPYNHSSADLDMPPTSSNATPRGSSVPPRSTNTLESTHPRSQDTHSASDPLNHPHSYESINGISTPPSLPWVSRCMSVLRKYARFVGPGLMVSVAYMDPGNYSTAVAAGSAYKYKLLFSILLSNCLAIFLQVLSAKLGAVTGLDLAANCRANLPWKLNIFIYILAEIAIIATDLAEVVGTAIALNILFKIPLILGVVLTVFDVLVVLLAYRPNGPLIFIRIFEGFVSFLVALTVICFGVELYSISHDKSINFSTLEVLKGFLPSPEVVDLSDRKGGNGLFLSLAILGATVMPHSLYLGSGVVQSRLKDFDIKHGFYVPPKEEPQQQSQEQHLPTDLDITMTDSSEDTNYYRPSIHAINDTMTYTIVELVISLFTVALFVNSAILIVAGATLRNNSKRDDHHHNDHYDNGHDSDDDSDDETYQNADLFTIYHLLSSHISPNAGFVFALALLFSGQSAGVVCTLAGQMVSEGFLSWSFPPAIRRLVTRGLAILPCFVVVSFAGRSGLATVLNVSQVVLSILLPVVSAPLIWFTCSKSIMRVPLLVRDGDEQIDMTYDTDDDSFHYIDSNASTLTPRKVPSSAKFKSTEPAIRLQNLRNSHPCLGVDDEDDDEVALRDGEHQRLMATNEFSHQRQSLDESIIDTGDEDIYRVKGYKDMSNSPLSTFVAVSVWAFITGLNIFLIASTFYADD